MAVQGPIPVEFAQVFPRALFAAGTFEPVRDFDRGGEGLVSVGTGPRDAACDGGRARPHLGVRSEADGTGVRPGAVRPVRPVRRRPRRQAARPHPDPGIPVRRCPGR